MFHAKELGLTKVTPIKSNQKDQVVSIDAAVETYLSLKGDGRRTQGLASQRAGLLDWLAEALEGDNVWF